MSELTHQSAGGGADEAVPQSSGQDLDLCPPYSDPPLTVGPTSRVGVIGNRAFYRTNILQQSAAVTCRSTQISQAMHDQRTNRTYITFSGGVECEDPKEPRFSAQNPYIVAYDHSSKTWERPVLLGDVRNDSTRRDCHNYPQLLVDSQGYLHVFHTFHFINRNIVHFKSKAPHAIGGPWERFEIPRTEGNTYGAAFKNADGHFYVVYRDTVWRRTSGGTGLWYEPERYVKSTDEGRTWSLPHMLIDPGRPSASDSDPLASGVTSLINDNGWNTVYVTNLFHDVARNRLIIDFTTTFEHGQQWGNRIIFFFDLSTDKVLTMRGTCLGSRIDRPAYLENECEGIRVYTGRYLLKYLQGYGRGLSQAIVVEDEVHGHPTMYYVRFESNNPSAGPESEEFYRSGWDRIRRARWTGCRWEDDYLSGIADPAADPFIQPDPLTQRRRETSHIWGAEYRGAEGTYIYTKTNWGGVPFWLSSDGTRDPEFNWQDPTKDYQYPGRVFNTKWPLTATGVPTNVRMFNDQHPLERRGISNFTLIPNGHSTMRACLRVPMYTTLTPAPSPADFRDQYAIGADYVWGEEPLQPLRAAIEGSGDES